MPQSDIDEAFGRTVDGVARGARHRDVLKLAASVADAFRNYTGGSGLDAKQLALEVPSLLNGGPVETQATISAWAEATFGPAGSNARAVARANREMAELLEHVTSDDHHPEAAEEIADVVIVLYRVATRLGIDLHERIDAKMARNRVRRWRLDGTGHGYHVPPEPPHRYIDRPNEYDPPTPAELEEHARKRRDSSEHRIDPLKLDALLAKLRAFFIGEFARTEHRQCVGVDLFYSPGDGFRDEEIRTWVRADDPEIFENVEKLSASILQIAAGDVDARGSGKHRFKTRTLQYCGARALFSFALSSSSLEDRHFRAERPVHDGYRRCAHGTLRGCSQCDWLAKIENLKPGDACEFRDPTERGKWLSGTVVENNLAGYWRIRGADGAIHGFYIESIRLPGQEEAWR